VYIKLVEYILKSFALSPSLELPTYKHFISYVSMYDMCSILHMPNSSTSSRKELNKIFVQPSYVAVYRNVALTNISYQSSLPYFISWYNRGTPVTWQFQKSTHPPYCHHQLQGIRKYKIWVCSNGSVHTEFHENL